MADVLTSTARQVRIARSDLPVHAMIRNRFDHRTGRIYGTRCGKVLAAVEGAMLTTREVTCTGCMSNGITSKPGPKPGVPR